MSGAGVRVPALASGSGRAEDPTPYATPVPVSDLEPFAWLARTRSGRVLLYLIPPELFGSYLPPLPLFLVLVEGPEAPLYTCIWRVQLHALGVHAACQSD